MNKLRELVKRGGVQLTVLAFCAAVLVLTIGDSLLLSRRSWMGYDVDCTFVCSGVAAFVIHFLFWFSLLLLGVLNRFVGYVVVPVIVFIQIGVNYATSRYGAVTNELAIAAYNTNWSEFKHYLGFKTVVLFGAVIGCITMLVVLLRYVLSHENLKRKQLWACAGLCVCVLSIAVPEWVRLHVPSLGRLSLRCVLKMHPWLLDFPRKQTPAEACDTILSSAEVVPPFYQNSYVPVYDNLVFFSSLWKFLNPEQLEKSAMSPSTVVFNSLPRAVVLYIGESFRADHSPYNEYCRNTLPKVTALSNIINFPHLHSRETQTITSIYSILTLWDELKNKATHSSFLDILKKHGYQSYLMVGANTEGTWYNSPLIAPILKGNITLDSRPASVSEYQDACRKLMSQQKSPLFLLIEDGAGHMPYVSSTYPFGTKNVIDLYDNALIDVDMRVAGIIETLKEEDAILFFSSDHGESFGEGGRFGHGGSKTAKEQLHICGFLWYSDEYARRRPEIIQNLKDNAANFVSLNQFYHTIISMCGLSSDVQKAEHDMTRASRKK